MIDEEKLHTHKRRREGSLYIGIYVFLKAHHRGETLSSSSPPPSGGTIYILKSRRRHHLRYRSWNSASIMGAVSPKKMHTSHTLFFLGGGWLGGLIKARIYSSKDECGEEKKS